MKRTQTNNTKRILFHGDDFKSRIWGEELKKYNYKVIERADRTLASHLKIILSGVYNQQRIHVFIFRYLNDCPSLYESNLHLIRDILIVCLCKILRIKIFWILHNIDRETQQHHPLLTRAKRKIVYSASKKIFVTDPNLVDVAAKYGIQKDKVSWICFGRPCRQKPDKKNIDLRSQIKSFRRKLEQENNSPVFLGLCVSEPAEKKLHYLKASSIVGVSKNENKGCVGLVMIGSFPEGQTFEDAKLRVQKSPYILFIEDSFFVNEPFISDQIDFFYRSLNDQSVPYTLYVATDVKKPMITHRVGALPTIVGRENLGYIIAEDEKDIPGSIIQSIKSWNPAGAENFLKNRSWEIAAMRIKSAIENEDIK